MKKVALFILATVAPAFGAYTYYVTDGLTSASGNWTQNGTTSFTSTGFTSSGSSGLVSTVTPTGPADSTYEVRMVLSLTQSGGHLRHTRADWSITWLPNCRRESRRQRGTIRYRARANRPIRTPRTSVLWGGTDHQSGDPTHQQRERVTDVCWIVGRWS